jgi:hypothetical protein
MSSPFLYHNVENHNCIKTGTLPGGMDFKGMARIHCINTFQARRNVLQSLTTDSRHHN